MYLRKRLWLNPRTPHYWGILLDGQKKITENYQTRYSMSQPRCEVEISKKQEIPYESISSIFATKLFLISSCVLRGLPIALSINLITLTPPGEKQKLLISPWRLNRMSLYTRHINFLKSRFTLCTNRFNIQKLQVLPTQYVVTCSVFVT